MLWDFILVGGGLSGSVLSNQLLQQDPTRRILLVEAGSSALSDPSVMYANSTNSTSGIGGIYDWNITSVPQVYADNRTISLPQGKALGGGTVINAAIWIRGSRLDYDLWGDAVNDSRWSYDGLLPYLRATEKMWNSTLDPDQHGQDGPLELGYTDRPGLDGNVGDPNGISMQQENHNDGKRQIAAAVYPLDGITVLLETMVARLVIEQHGDATDELVATGIELTNGTVMSAREIILSAGGIHSPQLLKVSGIGPAEELRTHGIEVLVDAPDVGENYIDHPSTYFYYNFRNSSAGWAVGSDNPVLDEPQFELGMDIQLPVSGGVPQAGLIEAITADEGGVAPDPATHPLLRANRTFTEFALQQGGADDGSKMIFGAFAMMPTSRGTVRLASANISDHPLADPNYLATEVDRYVFRSMVRTQLEFAGGNATVFGRNILSGEDPTAYGFTEPMEVGSSDDYLDERIRATIGTTYHPHGTCAMGKVVDTDFRVKGVKGLRVVDASVYPVPITGHLQAVTYAMAQQAAEIIGGENTSGTSTRKV
ncbi:hypothetical protein INS49_001818 [Diaporthe citri]|uniref:uncharacterized protein n=1 Tax=Diaporthe citri TaxID=83186 RepID=UPI001C7E5168|nr:uncharacterized protein INS49_001818 [Diaporthe citri]KAG6367625.1 hypothetical protein INS49_001818 [Diaporthe citri]